MDCVEDLKAAAECGVGLGPIPHRFVDLPENSMGRDFFETKGTPRCGGKRLANSIEGLVVVTCDQMDLGAGDLSIRDRDPLRLDDARRHFIEKTIENPPGVVRLSQLRVGHRQPGGGKNYHRPLADLPRDRQCALGSQDGFVPQPPVVIRLSVHRAPCPQLGIIESVGDLAHPSSENERLIELAGPGVVTASASRHDESLAQLVTLCPEDFDCSREMLE